MAKVTPPTAPANKGPATSAASGAGTTTAPAPAAPAADGTTAAPAEKKKRVAKKREAHPLVGNTDPTKYPFSAIPADYDPKKHKPLKLKNFKDEATFLDYKAARLDAKAASLTASANLLREEAKQERLYGNSDKAKLAKKRAKLQAQLAELEKELAADGVDGKPA